MPVFHAGCAALALLTGLTGLGCEEDCDWGAMRCNGGDLEVCEEVTSDGHSMGDAWITQGCPGVCVDLDGEEPFCAEDDEPDPRCDVNVDESKCVGELLLLCTHGYAGRIKDCGAEAGYCVDLQGNSAQCAMEAEPNVVCDSGGRVEACDGDALVVCNNHYVTARQDCRETGEYCVDVASFTDCRLSAQPDPRCPSGYDTVCDGELLISCTDGYIASSEPCPAGKFCKLKDCEFCDPNYLRGYCANAE